MLELQNALEKQRQAFAADRFPALRQRQDSLRRIETLLKTRQTAIMDAIAADFGNRSRTETAFSEILPVIGASAYARRHLRGWMRTRRRTVRMNFQPATNRVGYP